MLTFNPSAPEPAFFSRTSRNCPDRRMSPGTLSGRFLKGRVRENPVPDTINCLVKVFQFLVNIQTRTIL